jgi:hypothetical protein
MKENNSTADALMEPWCDVCGARHRKSTACSPIVTTFPDDGKYILVKPVEWDGPPTFHSRVKF